MKKILSIVVILFGLIWVISSASCINQTKNSKISFGINFELGTSTEEFDKLISDIKNAYPTARIEKFSDEAAISRGENRQPATLSIWASTRELVSEQEFTNFLNVEFAKYKSLKIRSIYGSSGSIKGLFDRSMGTSFCLSPFSIPVFIGNILTSIVK